MKYTFEVEDGGSIDIFMRKILSYSNEVIEEDLITSISMGVQLTLDEEIDQHEEVKIAVKAFACQAAFLRIVQAIKRQQQKQAELN